MVATLIKIRDTASINWILIIVGLLVDAASSSGCRPRGKKTKMTAMPQLVALFNGVGGAARLR